MKPLFILLFLSAFTISKAQIKEINPAIGWNYVKTQELEMTDEVWYNTDFSAETGFDYIFVMNHNLDSIKASLQLYDLQDTYLLSHNSENSVQVHSLPFDVKESGMYRIFFAINDMIEGSATHKVQFTLIRRKKI